jgi:hypothetical protein
MKRLVTLLLLLALSFTVFAKPKAGNVSKKLPYINYGALAFHHTERIWTTAVDYPSQHKADKAALKKCRQAGCRIVVQFQNGCAAYATGKKGKNVGKRAYGWAVANSGWKARRYAKKYCSSNGGRSCRIRVWACTSPVKL